MGKPRFWAVMVKQKWISHILHGFLQWKLAMTGFKLWCIVSSGITHGDVMRFRGDTVGSQWNTWSTSYWLVCFGSRFKPGPSLTDRQVYLSWAANRGRRRYDHANLTGWASQIMFVDVPSLNVIFLEKRGLLWQLALELWGLIKKWDLTSGFLQILLGMSGDLSSSFQSWDILVHTSERTW